MQQGKHHALGTAEGAVKSRKPMEGAGQHIYRFTDLLIYGFSAAKLHFIHQMAKKKPKNVSEIGRLTCFCHNYARQSEQRDKVGDSHETIEQVGYVPDDVQLNDGSDKDGSDVEHPI